MTDPTSVAGLVAWYDFTDISTLWKDTGRTSPVTADGDMIKGVTDKSGNGLHLSEATNGPTYKTNIVTGHSVARFDGTNDQLSRAAVALPDTGVTVFAVVKYTASNYGQIVSYGTSASGTWNLRQNALTGKPEFVNGADNLPATGSTNRAGAWHIIAGKLTTGDGWTVYVDGTSEGSGSDAFTMSASQTLWLGARGDGLFLNGDLVEVAAYNLKLADLDQATIDTYFADRYGLTVSDYVPSGTALFGTPGTFGALLGTFGGLMVGPPGSGIGCTIEIAFSDGPLSIPSTWTDVSAYVRKLNTRRGRNHELGKTSAGVATITLNNRDRRFDPMNTSSPYYPNIKPMKPVRITLTWALAPHLIFYGFVEDWGQQWGGPAAAGKGDATCEITASDGFKVLELMETVSYRDAVLADHPALYFPMDDPLESVTGVNLGDGGDGADVLTYFPIPGAGSVTPGARSDGPFASTADQVAVDFRNPTDAGAPAYLPAAEVTLQASPLTIEFWIRPDSLSGTPNYIVSQAGDYWHVITSATGQVSFEYVANRTHGVGFTGAGSTANLTPAGQTHHIAVVRDVDSISFYQDGMWSQTYDGFADPVAIPGGAFGLNKIGSSFDGVLAHLAIYPTALSADQINAHYMAACEVITNIPSGAAIDDILNCVGWPAGLRSIGTGASNVTLTPSGSALDVVQQIGEDTEHGVVEITPDGRFTFIDRNALHTLGASLVTFGDGGGAEIPYRDLILSYDDQDLWTEVVASGPQGTFAAADDTAVATYGRRTLSVSTVEATANATAAQATGLLSRYKAPAVRPTSITFMGPRSIAAQLSYAVGDRVTVVRRPPGGGTVTVDALIEGVNHDVGPDAWPVTTFALAPPDPAVFWILGTSTLGTDTFPGW